MLASNPKFLASTIASIKAHNELNARNSIPFGMSGKSYSRMLSMTQREKRTTLV